MQDSSNSGALAVELLQSCTKPSIWNLAVAIYLLKYRENIFYEKSKSPHD